MSYGLGFPTQAYIGQYITTPSSRARPAEGPKSLWVQLIWNNATAQSLGSGVIIQIPSHLVGSLSQISSIFVDNSQSVSDIIIVFPDTNQTIYVPAGYQSLYPVYTAGTTCIAYQVTPDTLSTTAVYLINQYEAPFISSPRYPFNTGLYAQNGAIVLTFNGTPASPDWPTFITATGGSLSAIKIDYAATCANANDLLIMSLFDPLGNTVWANNTLSPATANTLFSRYDFSSGLHIRWGEQGLKFEAHTLSGGAFNIDNCALEIFT